MTKQYKIVLLTAAAVTAMFLTQARAGAQYQAVGSDGIAASPKVRLMLNEHARSAQPQFTVAAVSGGQAAVTKTSHNQDDCCGSMLPANDQDVPACAQ